MRVGRNRRQFMQLLQRRQRFIEVVLQERFERIVLKCKGLQLSSGSFPASRIFSRDDTGASSDPLLQRSSCKDCKVLDKFDKRKHVQTAQGRLRTVVWVSGLACAVSRSPVLAADCCRIDRHIDTVDQCDVCLGAPACVSCWRTVRQQLVDLWVQQKEDRKHAKTLEFMLQNIGEVAI